MGNERDLSARLVSYLAVHEVQNERKPVYICVSSLPSHLLYYKAQDYGTS